MTQSLFVILKYAIWNVRGYTSATPSSFPHRMGCTNSDMFRVGVSATEVLPFVGGIAMADFHAAFLTSPLFKLELWLLSMSGHANKETVDDAHLHAVARGEERSFGPWSTFGTEGNRQLPFLFPSSVTSGAETMNERASARKEAESCTVIMRSEFPNGRPFCDTWWSIERPMEERDHPNDDPSHQHIELTFGTALIAERNGVVSSLPSSLLIRMATPLHRLYSRFLLASAKAKLVEMLQMRARNRIK
jgi:hypothetical protein